MISTTERVHAGSGIESHYVQTTYLPTGEPTTITRTSSGGGAAVTRWMQYDTMGRMVLNVEPNTTKGFNPSPSTSPSAMHAWRYAYNDAGDLVGTSDARGCGVNYSYDMGGRIVAEDYSPCMIGQQTYSPPDITNGVGVEVLYRYDVAEPGNTTINDCFINPALLLGRVVSVSSRADHTLNGYDGRGRTTCVAKQVAKPDTPDDTLATRYAPRWYTQVAQYDGADRPVSATTGATVLVGSDGTSTVSTAYSQRGTVKSVGSSYGPLVTSITRAADGPVLQTVYGDVAATTSTMTYDARRRLSSVVTYRGPPALWTASPPLITPAPVTSGPSTLQTTLENLTYYYDEVDNPVAIMDGRNPSEWPAGAQPVSRTMAYDDLYRLTNIAYQYPQTTDTWGSPFAPENGGATDPRWGVPMPQVAFPNRVQAQSFAYDWLGNTTSTGDDANGFYDRSLGGITNGAASAGPYQLQSAGTGATQGGSLTAVYDDAGNLSSMAVSRPGNCLAPPSLSAVCSQRFVYEWDERGRLSRARRWDLASSGLATDPVPSGVPAAELRHAYDEGYGRVRKTALDDTGTESNTLYVFGSLELRRAAWIDSGDYDLSVWTEVPYLPVGRVHYAASDVPALPQATPTPLPTPHVLIALTDHLGSTDIVIDQATSELVESTTYQAYGATESDYRPARWESFREDDRFTGKEEDVEVGLQYFGARYYAPQLGRWVSADPLTVHGGGADLNAYAYVHGSVLRSTDRVGLDGTDPPSGAVSTQVRGPDGKDYQTIDLPQIDVTVEAPPRVPTAPAAAPEEGRWVNVCEDAFACFGRHPLEAPIERVDSPRDPIGAFDRAINTLERANYLLYALTDSTHQDLRSTIAQLGQLRRQLAIKALFEPTLRIGVISALEKTPANERAGEAARLEEYGGPGGGHHVPAKRAFAGAPGYDPEKALAIPNGELRRLGISHSAVTGAQMTGYRAWAATKQPLTWKAMEDIEINALVRGGMAQPMAEATVKKAIQALQGAGVSGPVRIPWGG